MDALTSIRRHHLVVLHLLHFLGHLLVVPLLKLEDLLGTFARLLNLLPRLDLLLLEEGDTVGEQLGIALYTIHREKHSQVKAVSKGLLGEPLNG